MKAPFLGAFFVSLDTLKTVMQGDRLKVKGMEDFSSEEQRILHFQLTRLISVLFKNHIILTEDLLEQHHQMMEKIEQILPEADKEKLDLVDYFDDAKYNYVRKRILDLGNGAMRECENILAQYDISFKKKRSD